MVEKDAWRLIYFVKMEKVNKMINCNLRIGCPHPSATLTCATSKLEDKGFINNFNVTLTWIETNTSEKT